MNLVSHSKPALFFLLLCLLSAGCGKNESEGDSSPAPALVSRKEPFVVSLVEAENRPVPRYLRATGELMAAQDSAVAADVTGKVLTAPVERGSEVDKGETLVTLDDRAATLTLAAAEASLELASSHLTLAEGELDRNKPLAESRAISQTVFDHLKADREAARAEVAAAQARRDLAEKTLKDTVIRAPFAGVVVERKVSVGEYVRVDTEVVRLVDLDWLRLRITIPETSAGHIREGQTVTFSVPAWPEEKFVCKVKYITPAVREATRDLLVEARVENSDRKLQPGMFAEGKLKLGETEAVLVLATAVRIIGNRRSVFLAEGGEATEVLVELGESLGDWIEIANGIESGAPVIGSPPPEMKDGDPVMAGGGSKEPQ